jgi:hypothetical protein
MKKLVILFSDKIFLNTGYKPNESFDYSDEKLIEIINSLTKKGYYITIYFRINTVYLSIDSGMPRR